MIYENYSFSTKSEVEKLLSHHDNDDIKKAIIGAINGIKDWEWLQNLCLNYIHNPDFWVAKTAITGISDIARIHRRLNIEKVRNSFNQVSNERLQPIIKSTLDDIKIFIG